MSTASSERAPLYGNWIKPRSAGIGPLGLGSTVAVFIGLVIVLIVSMTAGGWAALVVAAVFAVPLALASIPVDGRPLAVVLTTQAGWLWRWMRRGHQYRTGALTNLPISAGRPLPGVLARTKILSVVDGYDNEVGVIYRAGKNLYTVVLRCTADGAGLVEREVVDNWVAGYGGFLATLGAEQGLRGATVVVDTAPDTGTRLRGEYERTLSPEAPAVAQAVMSEVVERYPAASSDNAVYVALTYAGRELVRNGRDTDAVLTEIARQVPGLAATLIDAGGGDVEPVSAAELPAIARVAYDPATHAHFSAATAAGDPIELDWSEAGPVAAEEAWGSYRHDSGTSMTWEMTRAPAGTVYSHVLAPLLAPHPAFVRKRVALIYRPHDPGEATRVTERASNTASFTAKGGKGRVSASAERVVMAAEQAEREVAAGAGVTRFALMVTVTVGDETTLEEAAAAVNRLGQRSQLTLRRCYGHQAAAFATTLPVGFLPWEHAVLPTSVRDLL
jgi:hypothetical protein